MALVALKDVRKVHGDIVVLENITLAIEEGERVGLLGANGSGKSTLLRILAGIETNDGGERTVKRDLRMGYLPQEPEIDPALTVREAAAEGLSAHLETTKALDEVHHALAEPNLTPARLQALFDKQTKLEEQLDRMGGHDVGHQVEAILHVLGMEDLEARCSTLSGGERRRVALARILVAEPALLLLDEPTNHLDLAATIDRLEDLLLESRTPLVLVTHDRWFLDRRASYLGWSLDASASTSYEGGYGWTASSRSAERVAAVTPRSAAATSCATSPRGCAGRPPSAQGEAALPDRRRERADRRRAAGARRRGAPALRDDAARRERARRRGGERRATATAPGLPPAHLASSARATASGSSA